MDNVIQANRNAGLTLPYLRKLERENYLALAAVVLLSAAGFLGLLYHVGGSNYPDFVSNIMYPLTSFVGAGWAFITAYRAHYGPLKLQPSRQLAWLLVGLGLLANCVGGVYYTYLDRTNQVVFPSFADIGFTLFYPLVFLGVFLMPDTLRFRKGIALDALITTLCILGVSWLFFISKVFKVQVESNVTQSQLIVSVSYPVWDMLLILAIVLLIYRRPDRILYPSLFLLAAGILANIWADTGYAYTSAVGTYDSINFFIDPFWYFGFLLVGLAGLFQYAALAKRAYSVQEFPTQTGKHEALKRTDLTAAGIRRWRLTQGALIFLPLAILLALTLYYTANAFMHNQPGSLFLIVLTTIVGVLVAIRSWLATRENDKLVTALSKANAEQEAIVIERTQLYEDLRTAHERLQELDKLKDQFMITASHELRTPLTAVEGYLELLVQYGSAVPLEQQQEFLLKAQHACEELVLLLNNVMDASRLEIDAGIRPAHLVCVPVREEVRSVIALIEPQLAHEQRKVDVSIPASLAVRADPVRFRQVLLNLSVNALKYSPPTTPIAFSSRIVKNPVPGVVVSVIDRGNGISPQDQDRLFQRFVRLDQDLNSTVRGSGLGLYISQRLVEAMDGKIWVESKGIPGEGSQFNVQLPMAM
jgi:signal transduction histidine kinase